MRCWVHKTSSGGHARTCQITVNWWLMGRRSSCRHRYRYVTGVEVSDEGEGKVREIGCQYMSTGVSMCCVGVLPSPIDPIAGGHLLEYPVVRWWGEAMEESW